MYRYQSFFLCGTHWSEPHKFIQFADWVVSLLKPHFVAGFDGGPTCVLSASKLEDYGRRNPSLFGDYFKLSSHLRAEQLESFMIVAGRESQLYLKVEFLHVKIASGASNASSDRPTIQIPNGIRIASMSLRKDLWQKCRELGLADCIMQGWEQLFITSGAIYGYVTPTYFPRTDKSAQITPDFRLAVSNTEERSAMAHDHDIRYMRVTDFDYTRFVEGIYQLSYVSKTQLVNSGVRAQILAASGDVRSRVLRDAAGHEVGVAVELLNDSDAARQHCAEIFGDLLWAPSEV